MINESLEFNYKLKTYKQKGNLAWEYNPLRNLRVDVNTYFYKGQYYTDEEFEKKFGIKPTDDSVKNEVIKYQSGQLIDFDTDELKFSLNNPIEMIPHYSYDGSVDLIMSDNKNTPKIINTRFSTEGFNTYSVIDRQGDSDTNIYDSGNKFNSQISLQKIVKKIPKLEFVGTEEGGNLPIGHYHFYFTYLDADGNETDFVAESGLVALYIGNNPSNIRSGFRDENSQKMVRFTLSNIDSEYQYVRVYFTRATGDVLTEKIIVANRIEDKFLTKQGASEIIINGFEKITEVTLESINPVYQSVESNKTQAIAQNRLFLANTKSYQAEHQEFQSLSLMFLPQLNVDQEYSLRDNISNIKDTYYDPKFIYNYVGYEDQEIYRFGIVYLLNNGQLSEVYNVRGIKDLNNTSNQFTEIDCIKDIEKDISKWKINPIKYNSETFILDNGNVDKLENARGVVSLNDISGAQKWIIYGITFTVNENVLKYLKEKLKIKGFFFVRQKRIPLKLAQAWTIGVDENSHIPLIPVKGYDYIDYSYQSFVNTPSGILGPSQRIIDFAQPYGAICPDYDINSQFLNNFFTGGDFKVRYSKYQTAGYNLIGQLYSNYNAYLNNKSKWKYDNYYDTKIIGLEDSTKLVAIDDVLFSARAGEADEARLFEYVGSTPENGRNPTNVVRGNFGPYLGIVGLQYTGKLIDIMIPGYQPDSIDNYFKIRYNDLSSYFAISDRIDINDITIKEKYSLTCYRGDTYICLFTHRVNRNFNDSTSPTNDKIVNPNTWCNNVKLKGGQLVLISDKDKDLKKNDLYGGIDNVNVGDLNAVKLGMWVTIPVHSTYNLNLRTTDESYIDEESMFGHPRSFYPFTPKLTDGTYKIAEALCFNLGFGESLSQRYNYALQDAPILLSSFPNRISYSELNVPGSFQNGFRIFKGDNYRDYPMTYGYITKLIEFFGNLIVVFEHGIGLIPVNERVQAGDGPGGTVYVNTKNVLPENPRIISDKFGSQWSESIIKTPTGIYGVDTIAKKIWKVDNNGNITLLSDLKIQKFLNDNISLKERELTPIIGIRNVKTHFNAFKNDVMFTFYDDLHGFEERAWNLCYNESQDRFTTFYSWIPSYSENIYNQFFSFDRNTSKQIAKLGVSETKSQFADGITISDPIIEYFNNKVSRDFGQIVDPPSIAGKYLVGTLSLKNRELPEDCEIKYSLESDNMGNYKKFKIETEEIEETKEKISKLYYLGNYIDLCKELYVRIKEGKDIYPNDQEWKESLQYKNSLPIKTNDKGVPIRVNDDNSILSKLVIKLNIKAKVYINKSNTSLSYQDILAGNFNSNYSINTGLYQNSIYLIPRYNIQFLTTDFWKHGQSGIIDDCEDPKPCLWYGIQHPFEFEFVVANEPDSHKIFDNLQIISNHAAPESFHYEIIGDCYDFANDKKNMYIRQEATKELYQFNGSDITYDHDYSKQNSDFKPIDNSQYCKKSTIFPLYYCRQDSINEIEDSYHLYKDASGQKNYSSMAGAEIVYYDTLDEYRICNHAKAVDMNDTENGGRLRGNMQYKEDKWDVQINPINFVQKNEKQEDWINVYGNGNKKMVPAECNLFTPPAEIYNQNGDNITLPNDWERNIVDWSISDKINNEVKLKDKFIKIRVRYSGKDLAIISALRTLYSISFA